jgi:hypothetical protein
MEMKGWEEIERNDYATTWNHRLIKCVDDFGDVYYQFAEVYYDEENKPHSYTSVCMVSETVEGMQQIANRLLVATTQPVLDEKDFVQNKVEF